MQAALIVGFGSIGARHAQILAELGLQVVAVTRNPACAFPAFEKIEQALAQRAPDLVVICNETAQHLRTLEQLAGCGYTGIVLVEKPLSDRPLPTRSWPFAGIYIAYNLRFHPVMQALHDALATEKIISAQVYAGQYLPDWRPGRDYRQTYSARRDAGGGVLRDLSHELDYVQMLFGNCRRLAAIGGHFSALEIDSDDVWAVLMQLDRCPALTLQLNYLDRAPRREIIVNTEARSYRADLIAGTLRHDGTEQQFECGRNTTYRLQAQAIIAGNQATLASFSAGENVVNLINQIEAASAQACWIKS